MFLNQIVIHSIIRLNYHLQVIIIIHHHYMFDYPNKLLTQIYGFHNSLDFKELIMVMVIVMVVVVTIAHQKDLQRTIRQERKILNSIKEQHQVRFIIVVIQKGLVIGISRAGKAIAAMLRDFVISFQTNLIMLDLVMVFNSIIASYLVVVTFKFNIYFLFKIL